MIQEINWMEAWKDHYPPIPIGQRLLILPAWINPTQQDRIPIRIELGMAFGTGTHPTTQLCLRLVEDFFTGLESRSGWEVWNSKSPPGTGKHPGAWAGEATP